MGDEGRIHPRCQKFTHSPLLPPEQIPPLELSNHYTNKNFIFGYIHCFCTIFTLASYTFYTQAMLILVLIAVQYLQNVVFSFECSKSFLVRFLPPNKKILHQRLPSASLTGFPLPLSLIWKIW